MNTSPKKSVGAYSYEMQQKQDEKINAIDLQRQIHKGNSSEKSFENQVRLAVERGKKNFEGDFYVVVLFKKERLFRNVIRQYFFSRKSCPTPEYDQVVYHYLSKPKELKFLWVVPDKQSTLGLPNMQEELPREQYHLMQFAEDFKSGKLDKLCIHLNNEA